MSKNVDQVYRWAGAALLVLVVQIIAAENASAQLGGWKKADRNYSGRVEISSQVIAFGPPGRATTSFGPRPITPGRTIRFADQLGIYTIIEDVTLNGAGNFATFRTSVSYRWFGQRRTMRRTQVVRVTD